MCIHIDTGKTFHRCPVCNDLSCEECYNTECEKCFTCSEKCDECGKYCIRKHDTKDGPACNKCVNECRECREYTTTNTYCLDCGYICRICKRFTVCFKCSLCKEDVCENCRIGYQVADFEMGMDTTRSVKVS